MRRVAVLAGNPLILQLSANWSLAMTAKNYTSSTTTSSNNAIDEGACSMSETEREGNKTKRERKCKREREKDTDI